MKTIEEIMGLVDEMAACNSPAARHMLLVDVKSKLRELVREPVAYMHYPTKKPCVARLDFSPKATVQERSNGWISVPLSPYITNTSGVE